MKMVASGFGRGCEHQNKQTHLNLWDQKPEQRQESGKQWLRVEEASMEEQWRALCAKVQNNAHQLAFQTWRSASQVDDGQSLSVVRGGSVSQDHQDESVARNSMVRVVL